MDIYYLIMEILFLMIFLDLFCKYSPVENKKSLLYNFYGGNKKFKKI